MFLLALTNRTVAFPPLYTLCSPSVAAHPVHTRMHYDPPVLLHKSTFMQRISDYVRFGFTDYVDGVVRSERASAFVRKMARYYRTDLGSDRNHRARSKAGGEGCAILLLHAGAPDALSWILMVTPGQHPARVLERLRCALERDERIVVQGDYELVRYTRAGARPSFTWRMTEQTYRGVRARVIECVRKKDDEALRQLIYSLYRVPGFAGARRQVGKAVTLLRAEWKRGGRGCRAVTLPTRLPYVARLKSESIPLTAWLRRRNVSEPRTSMGFPDTT